MKNFLKAYPIPIISGILVLGFFLSYLLFSFLGGYEDMNEYFGWQSAVTLIFVFVVFASAYYYWKWQQKPIKQDEQNDTN